MNILITGVAGFIGSHLAERLIEAGHKIIGIDNFSGYYLRKIKEANIKGLRESRSFTFHEADILKIRTPTLEKLLQKTNVVLHEAAHPGVLQSWSNFKDYADNNILATERLLSAARKAHLLKFIYASSSSIYGNRYSCVERGLDEDLTPAPVSPYGMTKLAGEHLCNLYFKEHHIPTVVLRYFTVYGERQRPDMAFHKFIDLMLAGKVITINGDGEQSRDFTYIDDIVEANMLAICCSWFTGETVNIGSGKKNTINRVLEILEFMLRKKANRKYSPRQQGDVEETWANISKAKRLLNYKPKLTLEEGLARQIEWQKIFSNQRRKHEKPMR